MAVAFLTVMTPENVTSMAHDTLGDVLYLPEVLFLLLFVWLVFSSRTSVVSHKWFFYNGHQPVP